MRPTSTQVLVEHEGRWLAADVLDQVRSRADGHWRVVVRFTVEPGATYVLAMPADQCRTVEVDPAFVGERKAEGC